MGKVGECLYRVMSQCCRRVRLAFTSRNVTIWKPRRWRRDQMTDVLSLFSNRDIYIYIYKGKVHPITCHEGPEGEQRYSSTLSLTSALDGGG